MDDRYPERYFPEPAWGLGSEPGRSGFGRWEVGWGLQNSGGGPQGYGWEGGWQGGFGPRYGGGFGGGLAGSAWARHGRHAGRGPRGWTRSDERILEEINERLTIDPDVDATEIVVRVDAGEVTLEGEVEDRYSRRRAEDVAWDAPGVRDVHNRLRVSPRLASSDFVSDGVGPLDSGTASIVRR